MKIIKRITKFVKTFFLIAKRILLTGGPGTGKTSVINSFENEGYFCFHEVIREMTKNATTDSENATIIEANPIASVADPELFNQTLLRNRVQQFNEATLHHHDVLFYDRGIPDIVAYMDFFNQTYQQDFITQCKKNIYDKVFLFPIWKEIYVEDDERFESLEIAQKIDTSLRKVYTKLGYELIEVPFTSIKERCDFILNYLL